MPAAQNWRRGAVTGVMPNMLGLQNGAERDISGGSIWMRWLRDGLDVNLIVEVKLA